MDDVPLDASPVYRNLSHKSAVFGLTPLDLPFIFVPGNVVLLLGVFLGFSSLWGVLLSLAIAAALVALKWRKPDDYLERMLLVAFTPRRLSHKERDVMLRPLPLDRRGDPR
ncbi:MAG: hypothetical protein IT383_27425 [Deltaproteobacteria bacterium]|nr:hypothetical protein [Deltaproteobacteria bacterium]